MTGIIVDIQPKPIKTVYTPLDHNFGLTVVGGGSTSQFYYTNANQYIPNRLLSPTKIKPWLSIIDPDGILSDGDKTAQLIVNYYENLITNPIQSGSDYTVNADGSLTIKKNIPVDKPVQIICRATFIDTRSGKSLVFEDRVVLNTTPKSDERVSISIDKDIVMPFNPIVDNHLIDIKATVFLGGDVLTGNVAYFWYRKEKSTERLIGSSDEDIEYVSGQGTKVLRINAENADNVTYICKAVYYTGAKPSKPGVNAVSAHTTLKWKLPPIKGDVYSPMGQFLRKGMDKMTFTCRLFDNQREIKDIGKYFFVQWYKKSTTAGATPVEVGHGVSISLNASELQMSGGAQMLVYPVVKALGNYQILADNKGNILDNNGNILIAR